MNLIPILNKAVHQPLSEGEAYQAALALMTGDVPASQVGALLGALRTRGESALEILGFARALREKASPFPLSPEGLVDTCGTGGDGLSTVNVSTLAALTVAACGVRVAKHGNRAVSSRCGSADLLEALGVKIDLSPALTARSIQETGFGFLLAPLYHQTLRHVAPIRRELGFRSIFNLVGPLANPASVKRQVVGVPSPAHLRPMAEALHLLGSEHAYVVHGDDGSDEVSLTGPTTVFEVRPNGLTAMTLHPGDAGLPTCRPADLTGGDAATNMDRAHRVLSGEPGPSFDFVVLNSALALMAAGQATSLREGASKSREALVSGRSLSVLNAARTLSQEAA
ncbi:MAG: anthranilate phosphoribosyltransferase [Vicinamibacteria bacterium]